jgi:hypothetical protein
MGDDYGPSLGRGLGVGSTSDQVVSNTPLSAQHMNHGEMHMSADIAPDANRVPGFPQDAFMEGPMMAMDDMVARPQNYLLRPGWSGFMQGMMTFVRVLPPDRYDRVMEQIQRGKPMKMQEMHHHAM